MTRKISLSKIKSPNDLKRKPVKIKSKIKNNKNILRKISVIFASIFIIIILIFFSIRDKFSIDTLLVNFKEQTGFSIILDKQSLWKFYPEIIYFNPNIEVKNKGSNFSLRKGNIIIKRKYWLNSPFFIELKSPIINLNNLDFTNTNILGKYNKNQIIFDKIESKLFEGKIITNGIVDLKNKIPFNFSGKFKNLSLNAFLEQSKITNWNRIKISLSSNKFNISGFAHNDYFINSLNGNVDISGSFYLKASEEERFGAALLSLLVEKIPSISSISESINFILSTYANIPSTINGKINIQDGLISTNEIKIKNSIGNSKLIGSINLLTNVIDGKIYLYQDNKNYIEVILKGNIENPEILIGGSTLNNNKNDLPKDIKKIFDEGINTLVDKLLKINE